MELNEQNLAKPEEKVVKFREREKWDRKIEFILSTIGFAVGLGNVWRFPYLCYKNGGGAFLIPYFVCLIAGGIPVFFLEVGIGQLTSQGGITVWETISPLYKGVGYASAIICFLLNIYYIVILAWAIHYFLASFTWNLPWATCGHWWNTPNCFDFSANGSGNRTISQLSLMAGNRTGHMKDAVVEYWENRVLGVSSGIDEIGGIQWELAGTLLISWIAVYFCIWKGVKSTGKVVYFTATFPYVMMTILLIRGVTLDGASDGIKFYLTPNFDMLWKGQVWIDAGTQIFFSYAIALGCMTALGSYNHYKHNFIRDCTFIACINSMTSLYAGFVIFSVLGFMAKEQGVSIDQVAESGPGLAFIVYPKAVAQMPGSPFWSVLFFFMIMLLGLDSQFVGVEGFVTAIVDVYPQILRVGYRREYFIAGVSFVSYLIGLSMVTNGGIYIFQLFDYYSASGMSLLWVCFVECIAVAWIYGVGKFCDDIKDMVGFKPSFWLAICWTYLTPILTMSILLYSIIYYEPLTYNKTYKYPRWAQGFGWMLALSSMLAIPIYFMYHHTRKALEDGDKTKRISDPETEMNEIKPVEMINGDGHI